jgi:putative polyhydroxyalkanoate system protein
MATIDVQHEHSLSKDEAKKKAEDLAKNMQTMFNLDWAWTGDTIQFQAPKGVARGTRGAVSVGDHDVHVAIDLPFMLRPMRATIESELHRQLDSLL